MWGERTEVQVSRREFHTYIYLDKVKIEFLSCIKKMHIYIYIYYESYPINHKAQKERVKKHSFYTMSIVV